MTLLRAAPAKVNLTLRVVGRRPDGYHDIESCMHALALHDDVALELTGDDGAIAIAVDRAHGGGHDVPTGPQNLVWRATEAWREASGRRDGVRFSLRKRIPAGGGLGGGSSDAAAALLLLEEAFGQPVGRPALDAVAAPLGADVAFFLDAGTQLASGVGDRLEPVATPPAFAFVLVLPPFGSSTPAVYQEWSRGGATSAAAGATRVPATPADFFNDLEAPALRLQPALAELRERIVAAGYPYVRMSGSGSTMFVAFEQSAEADAALEALAGLRAHGVGLLRTDSADNGGRPC